MIRPSVLALGLALFSSPLMAGDAFTTLGGGLPGTHGVPVLSGSGSLEGGSEVGVSLTGALESAPTWLIIGFSQVNAPFFGGTLVPAADVVLSGLQTDGDGEIIASGPWPFGIPFGTEFTFQFWIADGAGPVGFSASNAIAGTTPAGPVAGGFPEWIHGGDCANDPEIQVHQYNDSTWILRQSRCVNFEAPFMFLLFGEDRALLLDTGAGGIPIADTVYGLIDQWEATHGDVGLIVAHTHSHSDHFAGDSQFQGQPDTAVVGTSPLAVQDYYGFQNWPLDQTVLDLGGRKLDVLAIPGHNPTAIALYDRESGLALTGDNLYPGFLFVFAAAQGGQWEVYADSMDRLRNFLETVPVTHVLGTHVEMTSTPGVAYPYGTTFQPDERVLELGMEHIREVDDAMESLPTPVEDVHDDFIITPIN